MSIPNKNHQKVPLISHFSLDHIIVTDGKRKISQQAFLNDLHYVADALPDKKFSINLCKNRYFFFVGFIANVLKNQVNLLPGNDKPETILQVQSDFPDSALLDDEIIESLLAQRKFQTHSMANSGISPPLINPDQQVAIVFTSGSTGHPKPLKKTWRMLKGAAEKIQHRLKLSNALLIATVPPQHMYGLETSIFLNLSGEMSLYSGKSFYADDIKAAIELHSSAILITTPIHLNALLKSQRKIHPDLIISATSPLPEKVSQEVQASFLTPIVEIYGFSEAGSIATRQSLKTPSWELLPGVEISSSNDSIKVQADHLPTKEILHDEISLQTDRLFLLQGRSNDIIDIAGKRASLNGLNQSLLAIEGINDAVVFIPENQIRPAAMIVSKLTKKAIKQTLAQSLDDIFIPRPIIMVDKIKRGPTGKISKHELTEQFHHASHAATNNPTDPTCA